MRSLLFTCYCLALASLATTAQAAPARRAPAKRPVKPALTAPTPAPIRATPATADDQLLSDLIDETQKSVPAKDEMGLVWWLPSDFWRLSLKDTPGITPTQVDEVLSLMDTYTVVIVLDGHMNGTTAVYRSEAVTRSGLTIRDGAGNLYRPLSPEQLGDAAKMLSGILKPLLAQMAGPLGANMRIFYFPGKTGEGKRVVLPRDPGTFTISLRENEFRWRLPLSALVPKKTCPTCKEKFSGNYKFCPFDGEKLP